MNANVGGIDKTLRIVAGLCIIGWGVYAQSYWGAVGLIPLATALINWCPAYVPFGISSASKDD
jgi:hypothetical protein